ncbi:MAG TPA: thiamine pyrophosphate-dependent dehydrogenase E1 component subunit alpha [Longimicrobiales bacterium]|nr:thiamine pyrophosphate-dependent dehydrogenase E1 component subunit alpha [Longimicrobiales bacterium]
MKRSQLFDPPEYFNWKPDPELTRIYDDTIKQDAARSQIIKKLSQEKLLELYEGLVRARVLDYALKRWVRQGVISKAWLATGEEAVTIGNVHALDRGGKDVVAPMIRNASACHELGMSIERILHGALGTALSPTAGTDGHIGDLSLGIIQPISHVAEMVPVITGIALSFKNRNEKRVGLTWIGDGSTKTFASHEGLNLAAVLKVPAIFVIQNNQVALGTKLEQHQAGDFRAWGRMYGVPLLVVDGNNVLDVFAATTIARETAVSGKGPTIILANTFRMGGHATHDEAEARKTFAPELFELWGKREPIAMYEQWLIGVGVETSKLEAIEAKVTEEVDAAIEKVAAERQNVMPEGNAAELAGVSAGVRQPGLAWRIERHTSSRVTE